MLNIGSLADDFRDFVEAMNRNAVRFVLVGGYAVGFHGVVRATGDIDFLYEQTGANIDRLCTALREFGAPDRLIDRNFFLLLDAVTQIGIEPFRIDLLASISGVSFGEVRAGAIQVMLDGQSLLVIGLDELRRNKAATGRTKDKQDLRGLRAASATKQKKR